MSMNLISYQKTEPRLQHELFEIIFNDINENMTQKYIKKTIEAANFPINYDYKKSTDVPKLKLLIHCCLVEIDKLVRNFLSNKNDNPFVVVIENFVEYVKTKIIQLKNQNADLTTSNLRLRQKTGLLTDLCASVDYILSTKMTAREGNLNS